MNIIFITPFPETIISFMENSMIKKAQDKGLINYKILNLFDYADQPHQNIDDYPFGGGTGMVMKPEPIFRAFDDLKLNPKKGKMRVVYPSPDGKVFNQNEAKKLKENETLVFICGHYKGVDQRVRDNLITMELSIGNYVLSGGELPAAVLCDSIIRLIPGVLNNETSALTDSFQDNLLAPPVYTRPSIYNNIKVPELLLSGDKTKIEDWREKKSIEKTNKLRPEMLDE